MIYGRASARPGGSDGDDARASGTLDGRAAPHPAKAKAVIQLVQNGGPSQMDLFDPKPELTRLAGQPLPGGVEIHQPNNVNTLLPSPFEFQKRGGCGMDISNMLPHIAGIADELCFIRSMHTEAINHDPAITYMNTVRLGLEDERIHALILGYWHTIVTPPMVFARNMVQVVDEMKAKGIVKPVVASLAGDVEVEEAAQYLYEHGIPAYAYSTEIPVEILGAKYKWARGAGLL